MLLNANYACYVGGNEGIELGLYDVNEQGVSTDGIKETGGFQGDEFYGFEGSGFESDGSKQGVDDEEDYICSNYVPHVSANEEMIGI